MIAELAASGTALAWGAADYCGGRATRWTAAQAVVILAQLSSVPLLAVAIMATAGGWPVASDLGWGFLGGLAGGAGLVLLYGALAAGAMSVVAPVTAVTATLLPIAAGLVLDGLPGITQLAGVAVAVLAVGLISAVPGAALRVPKRMIVAAVAAGVAFGLYYVFLEPLSAQAGLWPLVGVRSAVLLVGLALLWRADAPLRMPGQALRWSVAAGALDLGANALYLAAVYLGIISVVAPIASLYPAGTVLLAVLVDRERLRPAQITALCLAAVALMLTHLG